MARKTKKRARRRLSVRRSHKRHAHRLLRRRLQRERRALANGQVPARLTRIPRLYAPEKFDLAQRGPRAELLKMLGSLRHLAVHRKYSVAIDFKHTTLMMPSGTLLFLAEVKQLMALSKGRQRISCRRVHDRKVNQVLHQIGFYQTIHRSTNVHATSEDVIHWRAVTGTGAEGEKAGDLIETAGGNLPESLNTPMYNGLVEAMTNCKQHAYLRPRGDGLSVTGRGEWHMFAQEHDGRLTVVFCDLGIGIPNSLPMTQGPGAVRQLLARIGAGAITDAGLIQAAIELGKSRSREAHRGKGLQDVVDVIDASGNGSLRIFSNAGSYSYRVRDGEGTTEYTNYPHSILGTLIQWTVPVRAEEPAQ